MKNNVLKLIEDKIQELEDQYKFGQEVYKGCPMHNIQFGINTLKELQKAIKEYGTQGEIVLPKEDKYEKFKEYIDGIAPHNCISQIKILFKDFEEEQEEKNREKEIKNKIFDAIKKEPIPVTDLYGKISYGAVSLTEDVVDRIYDKLKEGGYLK